MVQGQHGVGLAAAEVGLELHHRIAAPSGEAPHRRGEQPLQALGQEGAPEELVGVAVLVRPLAQMHLPEIRRELRLLVAPARDVLMGCGHHAPGCERPAPASVRCRRFDERAGRPAPLAAHLLVEHQPAQLHLDLRDLAGLRRRDRGEQPLRRIQRPVRVVAGEPLLVRPLVAPGAKLRHQAAFGEAEGVPEHVVPGLPHQPEQPGGVPVRHRPVRQRRVLGEAPDRVHAHGPGLDPLDHLALDKGREAGAEKLHRPADALVVGGGHGVVLFVLPFGDLRPDVHDVQRRRRVYRPREMNS